MQDHLIIDAHHHYQDTPDYVDRLAEEYARLGIAKVCLISPPGEEGIQKLYEAVRRYPDFILGLPMFDWERHTPDDITRWKEMGFAGVKFICPPLPYHHESFWPIYARCEELRMPGLFHLGIVGRMGLTGIMRAATRQDLPGRYFVDSNYMRPVYLDTIARLFPDWNIHGAHLGNPWYDEAAMSCRWNPNLYMDLSGSTLKCKSPEFLGQLLWWNRFTRYRDPDGRDAWEKIVFGSDVAYYETHDVLHDYDTVIRALGLSDEPRWKILGGTAAAIYGLS
ncbi:MAG: amidohydrolase family protein [Chloroflexi bacterium]|nr:amidohydrolase family protein [Chloroflexota bacterium]